MVWRRNKPKLKSESTKALYLPRRLALTFPVMDSISCQPLHQQPMVCQYIMCQCAQMTVHDIMWKKEKGWIHGMPAVHTHLTHANCWKIFSCLQEGVDSKVPLNPMCCGSPRNTLFGVLRLMVPAIQFGNCPLASDRTIDPRTPGPAVSCSG